MKAAPRRPWSREQGFGLVEMTVASAVMGLLMAGVFTLIFRSQVTFELQIANMGIRQQARVSLDRLVTELRLAGYRIDNLDEPISRGGSNVLQLVGDIDDSDPGAPCGAAFEDAVDGGAERVTYEVSVGRLMRSVECWDGAAWTPELSNQVVAMHLVGAQSLFRYFDAAGNEIVPAGAELTLAQRAAIRLVTVNLELLDTAEMEDGEHPEFDLSARVRLPNVD